MYVINDIHDMFREIERQAITTREATFLAAYVSWNYIDITENGQNMKPYEGHVNVQLERAFKDNKNQTTFRDTIGREYIVDFKSMEEYPVVDPTDRVKIIRKDLVQSKSRIIHSQYHCVKLTLPLTNLEQKNRSTVVTSA